MPIASDNGSPQSHKIVVTTPDSSRFQLLIDKTGVVRWIDTDVHVQMNGADVLAKVG